MNADELSAKMGREESGLLWLPDNIARFFNEHKCTIDISVCSTDVLNGYGKRITKCFKILMPFEECTRCGYNSLWRPEGWVKCNRHTYRRGWDSVFTYTLDDNEKKEPLEIKFEEFLQEQNKREHAIESHADTML